MKKIFKFIKAISLIILLIIVFTIIVNYGFKLKENFIGKNYVSYWHNHPEKFESLKQNEIFTFESLDKIVNDNDLILFGESHGTKEAQLIDIQLIKYLNKKNGMQNHLVELDFSQAYFINKYLENRNDSLINYVLKDWVVSMGRNNNDYYNKWKELKQYNKTLPDNKKITIIGIDKIQDFSITRKHISILFDRLHITKRIPKTDSLLIKWSKSELESIIQKTDTTNQNRLIMDLLLIQENIANYENKSRPKFLFDNFKKQYLRYNLKDQKIYGYFGLGHVIQKGMNNYDDFGTLIRKSDLPLNTKTFSIITLIVDSYMGAPTVTLPEPLRSNSDITKLPYTFDNIWIMYFYGINDLIKLTKEKTNTLFIIDSDDSPYRKSLRLVDNFSILPLLPENMSITDENSVSTDYTQGIFLIRNSDWAQPIDN
jgi:hypothetical protein